VLCVSTTVVSAVVSAAVVVSVWGVVVSPAVLFYAVHPVRINTSIKTDKTRIPDIL